MPYYRPTTLQDALSYRASTGARVLAGGTDVYPAIEHGPLQGDILDITNIAGLRGITTDDKGTRIGAATQWSEIANAQLPPAFTALQVAARQVGSVQIQNAGTIAGNICNASPAADGVPPLLILNASVEITGPSGIRAVSLAEFLKGVRHTDLAPDEMVTALLVQPQPETAHSAFEKLGSRTYLVISISMVAALVVLNSDGTIREARFAVGACSPVAQRLTQLEADCIGQHPSDVLITEAHLAGLSPISDVRGTADYRLDAVQHQCKRALLKAAQR